MIERQMMKLTKDEIEAAKTSKGGWTKATLERWGISWPPTKDWKKKLLAGYEPESEPNAPESNPNGFEAKLLLEVVATIVNAGQGDLLKQIDSLNAYYGNRIPTVEEIVGGRPKMAIVEGVITWEDKVYRFSVARSIGKCDIF